MKNKFFFLFILTLLVLFSVILLQYKSIRMLGKEAESRIAYQKCAENHIWASFWMQSVMSSSSLCSLMEESLAESDFVVFVPQSICRACFSSLLFQLQDYEFDFSKVHVISELNDFEIRSECSSRGIRYSSVNHSVVENAPLLIARKYQGFLPVMMDYGIEDAPLLPLFLSDSQNLLDQINNNDDSK